MTNARKRYLVQNENENTETGSRGQVLGHFALKTEAMAFAVAAKAANPEHTIVLFDKFAALDSNRRSVEIKN